MNKERFGSFIAEERRSAGMTQQMLAERLHVTDKAVSKWERGLCFPDLTLIEHLAAALGLTVTELMACQKQDQALPELQAAECSAQSLLNVAKETLQRYRRQRWVPAIAIATAAIVTVILIFACMLIHVNFLRPVSVYHKQEIGGNDYLYIEEGEHLLRLRCDDSEIYNAIVPMENMYYSIGYCWNRLTYQGTVSSYFPDRNITSEGGAMDSQGSSIGVGSLLGIDFVYQYNYRIYPDPQQERRYLRTLHYYYVGNGTDYGYGKDLPVTQLLTVENCRIALTEDFDMDGIVELLVLTKYDEEPYLVYDLIDGQIISYIPEEVPQTLRERLVNAAVW